MKSFFRDLAIGFVATLLIGGTVLWGRIWTSKLLEPKPLLEARKSERLSVDELLK